MMSDVWFGIALCALALLFTLGALRSERGSLGIPLAYLVALLLIHVPGAYVLLVSSRFGEPLTGSDAYVATGIKLTGLGACSFVLGLWLSRGTAPRRLQGHRERFPFPVDEPFWHFCLAGGLVLAIVLAPLQHVPSLGAAVVFGSSAWMLGTMCGLCFALYERRWPLFLAWAAACAIYPVEVFVFGGFLSYGSTAVLIVVAFLIIRARSFIRSVVYFWAVLYIGITVFVNYYGDRETLRLTLWSDAGMQDRLAAVAKTFSRFQPFSAENGAHLWALKERLNQNEFVGLAVARIQNGDADFLHGRSFWEALLSLVPRILWPDKPVFGGSPEVVAEMTGLRLHPDTSWGVGNVMELYINFGVPSLVAGFLVLGLLLGRLDLAAYNAMEDGRYGDGLLAFLPAVALIQPNGSLVELAGGAAGAVVASFMWRFAWLRVEPILPGRRRTDLEPSSAP